MGRLVADVRGVTEAGYTIQGRTVRLPAVVRDASSGTALYLVSATAAQQLVPPPFQIVEVAPGQAQLVLGFVDYRDNDLGDYYEVMIVFFVRPAGDPAAAEGTFIYKLPVNQSFTCEAGQRIWGFPKTVERIAIDSTGEIVRCRLEMAGEHAFTLSLPRLACDAMPDMEIEMTTYTDHGGPHALAFAQGGATAINPGGAGVQLELGTHPLADELRRLGLPDAPLLLSTWVEHMRGSFGAPRRIEKE
ncbi:MAG TPA: acetoacetate decarboxylase family protein [Terriglobales bacterium]|nr:acetoacetate decarboxylase family protein [Terriglobales bacterium]